MQTRLLLVLAPALVLLVAALLAAYAVLVAQHATQETHADRAGDASRFASLVQIAVDGGDATRLNAELSAYEQLYSTPVWVVALEGGLLHDPGPELPDDDAATAALAAAFAGAQVGESPVVWPWEDEPLLVMEPVGSDSQVGAVVVLAAPTAGLRAHTLGRWGIGAAALLVPAGALVAAIVPLTRWVMRPVRRLEAVAARVRAGDLDARADVEHGPAELRELAGAFNAMVERVQRSLRRQRAFVADAAHQLRNPLTSLQLTVADLDHYVHDPEGRQVHREAVEETERLAAMFESMLAATRADVARDAVEPPLGLLLEHGGPRWRDRLAVAGLELVLIPGPAAGAAPRSPTGGLAGLLDELVDNAARLSNGTTLTLSTAADGPRGEVSLIVADDGEGLDPADLELATGRFWRSARHQNVAGTGLGLTIAFDAVQDVGGTLTLSATPGGGLTVTLVLPLAAPAG